MWGTFYGIVLLYNWRKKETKMSNEMKTNYKMKMSDKMFDLWKAQLPEKTTEILARVTAVYKERYALLWEEGELYGRLKTKEYYAGGEEFPTVGDMVLVRLKPGGDSLIVKTLERRTFFSRLNPTPGRGEQAVAANFDYVFLMQSLNQDFNLRRMERYLTMAWESGALPVVLLTKADLVETYAEQLRSMEQIAAGAAVYAISARTGEGMEALQRYLQPGKTVALLGSSGVGKSSLVNALTGSSVMAVNGIREADSRGHHTTTHRQLLVLDNGAMLIDTPGMRELGMWKLNSGLEEAFPDVEQYLGCCRFRDCRHETEPGCAIRQAIADGELSMERWKNYCTLKKEGGYARETASFLREKEKWHKAIAKTNRQRRRLSE